MSLKVLQHVGLVPALVNVIKVHNKAAAARHSCEEYICNMDNLDETGEEALEKQDVCLPQEFGGASENERESVDPAPEVANLENADDEASQDNSDQLNEARKEEKPKTYRINSPSYRQVQDEVEEFARIRSSLPGSSWMSENDREGLSPFYSRSPTASPSRSESPCPESVQESFSTYSSPQWLPSVESSPMSDVDDRCPQPIYSPIEHFSEDEETDQVNSVPKTDKSVQARSSNTIPLTLNITSSNRDSSMSPSSSPLPSPKRAKMSPSFVSMYQPMYIPPPIKRSISHSSNTSLSDESQIGIILQILSRYKHSL